jgi:hypothetical protein
MDIKNEDLKFQVESLMSNIDRLQIQINALEKILKNKGIVTDEEYQASIQFETQHTALGQAHQQYSDQLLEKRNNILGK